MTVHINYKKSNLKKNYSNLVLFVDEKFNISGLKKHISSFEFSYISDLLKNSDLKKDLLLFEINSKKTIFLASIKKELKTSDVENLGAKFHGYINYDKKNDYFINSDTINTKIKNFLGYFLHGLKLKSYEFNIYKSKKNKKIVSINVIGSKNKISTQDHLRFKALEEGSFFARDLVSEPGNILHPDEYAKRINSLKKFGLKINIYDEKKLKKLGMNALLGVGQGSIRGSYLVTIEWNGAKNKSNPLAFVGKGVCFDTGGYSLKPAKFMEDMTYDMAGSATVVGLMKNLAIRKAKINAVGVVGLVENMVSGNAQRTRGYSKILQWQNNRNIKY
jgi:leucyl aminopeptidase